MSRVQRVLFVSLLALTLCSSRVSTAQTTNLLTAPPMGWNSWNAYGCDINEDKIKAQAQALASNGMLKAGYRYLVMDDCWSAPTRDAQGNLQADPQKFPHGIKALADAVHALGLKFGMYADRGEKTCGGYPGSEGHETQDAAQFSRWGVDYLKYDNCNAQLDEKTQYQTMRQALSSLNRSIVLSICSWWFKPWIPEVGDLWRTTWDIKDVWDTQAIASSVDNQSVISIAETNNVYASYARTGHYNDPDMLMVGNRGQGGLGGPGMTDTEYRSHFSLWAIMSAPLFAGNRLSEMNAVTLETLTNPEVIAVNQDPADTPAHTQGVRVRRDATSEVWAKALSDGSVAVLLLNRGEAKADIRVGFADVGLRDDGVAVRDLWRRQDIGVFNAAFTATDIPAHGSVMLRLRGTKLEPELRRTVRLEAEAKGNTLVAPAEVRACADCSGKALVGNIRGAGSLRFNKVWVSRTGSVPVTVYFVNALNQGLLKVTSSAGANVIVRLHSSAGLVTSLRLNLELRRGENTITFSLPGAKAPSIDRISYETGQY